MARVRAAVEVARSLPVDFTLTARAENLLHGRMDMADTIRRLQAYEAAGADVLYAPGLRTVAEVRHVVGALKRPFNIVTGWQEREYSQMGIWPGETHYLHRYDYCAEYVSVMKELWDTGRSDLKGDYFTMDDCRCRRRRSRSSAPRRATAAPSLPPNMATIISAPVSASTSRCAWRRALPASSPPMPKAAATCRRCC